MKVHPETSSRIAYGSRIAFYEYYSFSHFTRRQENVTEIWTPKFASLPRPLGWVESEKSAYLYINSSSKEVPIKKYANNEYRRFVDPLSPENFLNRPFLHGNKPKKPGSPNFTCATVWTSFLKRFPSSSHDFEQWLMALFVAISRRRTGSKKKILRNMYHARDSWPPF
ncbi:hypothetical protein J6590_037005 [Homalodisca vitripennis]|nr:hypothetical protein J6590_037005 [Homalodisca vitripennis]